MKCQLGQLSYRVFIIGSQLISRVNLEQLKLNEKSYEEANITVVKSTREFLGKQNDYYQSMFNTQLCIYIYTSCILLLITMALLRSTAFLQYCLSSSTRLHNNMFRVIVKAPMRFYDTNPSGRVLNRFSKDIGAIDERLPVLLLDSMEVSQVSYLNYSFFINNKFDKPSLYLFFR